MRAPTADPLAFLDTLPHEVARLVSTSTDEKLEAFDDAATFLISLRGRSTREAILDALAATGYGERSARHELDALVGFLSRRHLEPLVNNPAVLPGGKALLDGGFVPLSSGVTITGVPVGPVLVVGSGNSFVPSMIASVLALLANCPVVLRGAAINQPILRQLFAALRTAGSRLLGDLLECVHLIFLDHADPGEGEQLRRLLRTGPFGAGNFWGGRAAIDTLVAELGHNPHHPMAIPMEPLTGIALVTDRFVRRHSGASTEAAEDLAEAMTEMGQQMCSSPTEAYFVGDLAEAHRFAREVGDALERSAWLRTRPLPARSAMLVDRIRERCAERDHVVLAPRDGDARWTVIVSDGGSVFTGDDPPPTLEIHERSAFLELVRVPTLDAVADHIERLPRAPCHRGIKQVQTLIRIAHLDDVQRVIQLLRRRGTGVFRAVPPSHVARRHHAEPLDGFHLVALFTRQVVVL